MAGSSASQTGGPAAPDTVIERGTQLNQAAMSGDAAAIVRADEYFARQRVLFPADPLVRAYAGACHARLATTTWLPWKKMSHAEDGLADLDKALAQLTSDHDVQMHRGVPVSLETRFVAASTFLGLPSMFNRRDRGDKLLGEVVRSPLFERTPAPFRAAVWMRAATAARADGRQADEKRLLGLVAASGAPQAAAAQALLKDLP